MKKEQVYFGIPKPTLVFTDRSLTIFAQYAFTPGIIVCRTFPGVYLPQPLLHYPHRLTYKKE